MELAIFSALLRFQDRVECGKGTELVYGRGTPHKKNLYWQGRKNIRNQGPGCRRKVSEIEEGLTRKSRINVANTSVVKAASLN